MSFEFTALQVAPHSCDCPQHRSCQHCTDGPHTSRCGDGAWESGRNPNLSPSSSTSSIISCSSSGVGFCPSILITFPSSLVLMHPSSAPSTKMSKAALNSGERGERRCEGVLPCTLTLQAGGSSQAQPPLTVHPSSAQAWRGGTPRHTTETALLEMLVNQNPWLMPCLGQSGQSIFQSVVAEAGWAAGWGARL